MLLSVDPGKWACGAALFWDGTLYRAAWIAASGKGPKEGPARWADTASAVVDWAFHYTDPRLVQRVVIERPPAYRTDKPHKTLELQNLVAVGAIICARFSAARPEACYPYEWEGTLNRKGKDDPIIERVRGRLHPAELARVELPSAASRAHNVWDAVGIGLKALGRFEPVKVYPGR